MHLDADSREALYVARQPIVDHAGKVFGYELLYRGAADDVACTADGDVASARVLSDTVLSLGLDTLTAGLPAFVNLTRPLLVSDVGTLLPAATTVLELREDIAVDDEVIESCRRLQAKGYALALDDYTWGSAAEVLLPFVKFVKVDVLALQPDEWERLAKELLPHGVQLIAEKAETAETVQRARAAGYRLFQGYFFCRPATVGRSALPSRSLVYMNLVAALGRPDLTVATLEDLIKHDVSLTYRVLRCINSAAYSFRQEIHSIRQALVLMGLDQIRKWAMVWSLAGLNGSAPETVIIALLRARTCEIVSESLPEAGDTSDYFLLGLCSLLDAMLGRSMSEALADLPLAAPIHEALLGQDNLPRSILDVVVAYEKGEWDDAERLARRVGLGPNALPTAYAEALRWARELSRHALTS